MALSETDNADDFILNLTPIQTMRQPVIFVIGGPGSGKATQCRKLAQEFDMHHISMGQAIKDVFSKAQTEHANRLQAAFDKGGLVPLEDAMYVLKYTLLKRLKERPKPFIIHGFPRYLYQAVYYEREIGFPRTVILLETDEDLMKQRLQERGETSRRADDLSEAIESRLTWFHNCIAEIAHYYGPHNKLYTVDANRSIDEVYTDMAQVVELWI